VSAGFIHGRYDLLVSGHAISARPVDEIIMTVDGAVTGRMHSGETDQPAQTTLPDGSAGLPYAFRLSVPSRRGEARRLCPCIIAVWTNDGKTIEPHFELSAETPAAAAPVQLIEGKSDTVIATEAPPLCRREPATAGEPGSPTTRAETSEAKPKRGRRRHVWYASAECAHGR